MDHACEWIEKGWEMEGSWDACGGNVFPKIEGTLKDNNINYCPYCGGEIDALGWAESLEGL